MMVELVPEVNRAFSAGAFSVSQILGRRHRLGMTPRLWRYLAADFTGNLLRSGETDLDWRIWLLRIHDYRLRRLHIDELVFDVFHGLQGKFLVFSYFKFQAPAPRVNESGYGLRRGGNLSFHQRDLRVTLLMFEQ